MTKRSDFRGFLALMNKANKEAYHAFNSFGSHLDLVVTFPNRAFKFGRYHDVMMSFNEKIKDILREHL
jgi:hypothetical protein